MPERTPERTVIERTYFDKCKIYRKVDSQENSITKQRRQLIYENIPCALSKQRQSIPTKQENYNENHQEHLLFISPELEIKPGDEVEVTLGATGGKERFWAGQGFIYPSHQQVPLSKGERV